MISTDDVFELFGTQFRRFLYDNFYSTETMNDAVTQTGYVIKYLSELELATGVQEASTAKVYYNFPAFNPHYSKLFFKLQFSSIQNIFAFVGFKETTNTPTFDMTESHAGFMFYNGSVYSSTGNNDPLNPLQQRIFIAGMVPTNNLVYRIIKNRFAYYPLPISEPYFDGIETVVSTRKWGAETLNGSVAPRNQDHYFMAHIENNTGADVQLRIKHVLYGEWYAD